MGDPWEDGSASSNRKRSRDPWCGEGGACDAGAASNDPWDGEGSDCQSETHYDSWDNVSDITDDDLEWGEIIDSDEEEEPTPCKVHEMLGEYLVRLYMDSTITASILCIICWYVAKCGVGGMVDRLKLDPSNQTGKFPRKVKSVLRLNRADHVMFVRCPGHAKTEMSRVRHWQPMVPIHESFHREFVEQPGMVDAVQGALARNELPRAYLEHPVAKRHNYTSIPGALYIDGLPTTKHDGVLNINVVNLVTGRRHICCIIRKSKMCRCGCKGWCTIWVALNFISWSLMACDDGVFPLMKCGGEPWDQHDAWRVAVAGLPIAGTLAIIFIRSDWMEQATTLGFYSWGSASNPCSTCWGNKRQWCSIEGINIDTLPWPDYTMTDYNEACNKCEHEITIPNAEIRDKLVSQLFWDFKNKAGWNGRALNNDIHIVEGGCVIHLVKGDRLEPDALLPDIGLFEKMIHSLVGLFFGESRRKQFVTIVTRCSRRSWGSPLCAWFLIHCIVSI